MTTRPFMSGEANLTSYGAGLSFTDGGDTFAYAMHLNSFSARVTH